MKRIRAGSKQKLEDVKVNFGMLMGFIRESGDGIDVAHKVVVPRLWSGCLTG
jgi:hypothetical protein